MAFGLTDGLAVRENHDKDIENIKYFDQKRKQDEALLAAKSAMFLNDIDFQNGSNPYDDAEIKKETKATLDQLGALRRAHASDWTYSPDVQLQMKQIKNGLKSTPAVLRSVAYKDALGKYNSVFDDAVKHPDKYNLDEIAKMRDGITNYGKFGHADGEAGIQRDGGAQPLIFTPPQELTDINKLELETGKALEPQDFKTLNNGRDGAFIGQIGDNDLINHAKALYNKDKYTYDYKNEGKTPDQIITGIAQRLKPLVPVKFDNGDRNPVSDANAVFDHQARVKAVLAKQAAGHEVDPYNSVIRSSASIKTDPADLAKTFGSTGEYSYTDAKGNLAHGNGDFNYDGDIFDNGFRKDLKYNRTGYKVTPGYVHKTIDWAKNEGFLTDPMFGKPKVKPEYEDRIKIVDGPIGDDGKAAKIIELKAIKDVNANSAESRLKYNKLFATTKQRDGLGIEDYSNEPSSGPEIGSVQGGYQYTGGDPASQNSWKKL